MKRFYSNDFSDQGMDNGNVAFLPQQNDTIGLGWMLVGRSPYNFTGTSIYADGHGLTLTVEPTGSTYKESAAVVALETQGLGILPLKNGGTLTAEIYFDRPMAYFPGPILPENYNPLDYAWGIALVLKDGNQDETGTKYDKRISARCQFFSGGLIHFHGTDYDSEPSNLDPLYDRKLVATQSYQDYLRTESQLATEFRLSMAISRYEVGGQVNLHGAATLQIGSKSFSGNLDFKPTGDPKSPPYTDIDWATGIGVAIVSTKNLLSSFSVHLKKFNFSVSDKHVSNRLLAELPDT